MRLGIALVVVASLVALAQGGRAIGLVDQRLTGDPACNAANFPGASAGGQLLQEFVTDATGLSSVEVCVDTGTHPVKLTAVIRGGNLARVTESLATGTATVPANSFGYASLLLRDVLVTTPGDSYVIQLYGDRPFRWRATAPTPDLYPRGVSNRFDAADFGFRTIPGDPPNPPVGTADQKLTNDPSCDTSNFPGYGSSIEPLVQEFVPAATGLKAVDLCVSAVRAGIEVRVNVRAGTAAAQGAILASGSAKTKRPGLQWVRVEFVAPVATTPGGRYLIEVPDSGSFHWRDTCPSLGATCGSVRPDRYPAGSAADGRDYGFRTIAGAATFSRRALFVANDAGR